MKTTVSTNTKKILTLLMLTASIAVVASAATEWTFNTAGDLQGWQPNGQLTGSAVSDGALTALTSAEDPFFMIPDLQVAAGEYSSVIVRLKIQGADGSPVSDQGEAQLFWRTTTSPTESEEASVRVETVGDGQWHDYKFTVGENENWKDTVTSLRFDPCIGGGVKISIDSVRLQGSASAAAKAVPEWTFDTPDNLQGWNPAQNLVGAAVKDGALTALTEGEDPIFMSPPLKAAAKDFPSVVVRMKLQNADGTPFSDSNEAQLFWRTSVAPDESEEASVRVETAGDGQFHDYKFAVNENENWKDLVTGLRIDPCSVPGVRVAIDSVKLQK